MPRKRIGVSKSKRVALPILNPDAAGIDIGATEIYVAAPADRNPEPIRMFATFAQDLKLPYIRQFQEFTASGFSPQFVGTTHNLAPFRTSLPTKVPTANFNTIHVSSSTLSGQQGDGDPPGPMG